MKLSVVKNQVILYSFASPSPTLSYFIT